MMELCFAVLLNYSCLMKRHSPPPAIPYLCFIIGSGTVRHERRERWKLAVGNWTATVSISYFPTTITQFPTHLPGGKIHASSWKTTQQLWPTAPVNTRIRNNCDQLTAPINYLAYSRDLFICHLPVPVLNYWKHLSDSIWTR